MPKGTRPTSGPQTGSPPQTSKFYGLDWKSLAGSTLSAAKSLGSAFGFGGDNSDESRHRIRKIVRDAQESGIHPLYALGAGGGYSPGFQSNDGGGIRQGVAALDAVYRGYTAEQQAKQAAGLDLQFSQAQIRAANAAAERDETQAQLNLSESARLTSGLHSGGRDNTTVTQTPELGAFTTPPAQVISSRPGAPELQEGPAQPVFIEGKLGDGSTIRLPNQNLMETGELLPWYLYARQAFIDVTKKLSVGPDPGAARRAQTQQTLKEVRAWLDRAYSKLKGNASKFNRRGG